MKLNKNKLIINALENIRKKSENIAVVGLGYVGLPLALTFAENDFSVVGIDIDPSMHLSTAKLAAEGAHEQSRGVQHLMHELALLKMLPPSPFLVHCTCAFQDEYHCYFGLEYMHGGDLRHYLNARMHTLDYKEVRFYVASMTLALVHLHSNGILHRDVRPENILIDSKG